MNLKLILENKINLLPQNKYFYTIICLGIFLLSIFIRSLADIGPDTSVYLDVGKKLALKKQYYDDIFEINFPLTMWFYALQYKISQALDISPIIIAEWVVNISAILSILWSKKILKKTQYYQDKALYNLLIISFFIGFFLRPYAFLIFEFGTKTSYFLILFYPYLALSLQNYSSLTKKDLLIKGIIMALIASLKPHYILLFLIFESYLCLKNRSLFMVFGLDKLISIALYLLYILAIFKFAPSFFSEVVPMWSSYFNIYNSFIKFIESVYGNFSFMIFPYLSVFLIYARFKMQEIDKKLLYIFIGSSAVVLIEKIFTNDQYSLFCAINTPLLLRILTIILRHNFFNFSQNLFFLGFLIIVPLAENDFLRLSIFSVSGVFNVWWVMIIYSFVAVYKKLDESQKLKFFSRKKIIFYISAYSVALIATLLSPFKDLWLSNFISLACYFTFFFIFEKKFQPKIQNQMSRFSIFMIMASIFVSIHNYSDNFRNMMAQDGYKNRALQINDFKAFYHKIYAPKTNDYELNFYDLHQLAHPFTTYFKKDSPSVISIYGLNSNISHNRMMFAINNEQSNFVFDYVLRDLKKNLTNNSAKLIFIDTKRINDISTQKCIIGYLEYLFFDKEIK
ncbi:MAG: hypothetical protein EBS92_06875, partial [Proteobacteria bacterium]|nr:hypothetical protein [Pseudomonadota bacterium]